METKRLILAAGLSLVVIILYQQFFMPKPVPQPVKPQTGQQEAGQSSAGKSMPSETTEDKAKPQDKTKVRDFSSAFAQEDKVKPVETEEQGEIVSENIVADTDRLITVETDKYMAVITNKGAGLKSFILKEYNDDFGAPLELISKLSDKSQIYPLYFSPFSADSESRELANTINNARFVFSGSSQIFVEGGAPQTLEFKFADVEKKLAVTKTLTLANSTYVVGINYEVIKDGQKISPPIVFGPDLEDKTQHEGKEPSRFLLSGLEYGAYDGNDFFTEEFLDIKTSPVNPDDKNFQRGDGDPRGNLFWASYQTNYFAALFKLPSGAQIKPYVLKEISEVANEEGEIEKKEQLFSYIAVESPESFYLGPKSERILETVDSVYGYTDANEVVDYGWSFFGAIAKILLKGILFFHNFIPNMGWALVLFTLLVKILLFPLTYKSSVSMAKMQTLQPKLKALKKKYNMKDMEQRKQLNIETMALYKSEKVNPVGGCLPMLLQMPILFAFFRLLPISIEFRHEPWILWITDLSVKDPLYIIPILMGVTQLIVSKMSPTTADANQKKIMYIMPIFFVFLFMSYAAGLTLYWFISNLCQIGQQYYINEKVFKEKKEEEKLKKAQKRKKGGRLK